MTIFVTLQQIDEAVDAIRERTSYQPRVGLILGSGLNTLADSVRTRILSLMEKYHWQYPPCMVILDDW
jgi:purine nucleoside phosphorylase